MIKFVLDNRTKPIGVTEYIIAENIKVASKLLKK
jgi:hypothetical protein